METITEIKKLKQWRDNRPDGFVLRTIIEKKKKRKKLHLTTCESLDKDHKNEHDKTGRKPLAREPIFECYVKTEKIPKKVSKKQQCSTCKPCTT